MPLNLLVMFIAKAYFLGNASIIVSIFTGSTLLFFLPQQMPDDIAMVIAMSSGVATFYFLISRPIWVIYRKRNEVTIFLFMLMVSPLLITMSFVFQLVTAFAGLISLTIISTAMFYQKMVVEYGK